MAYYPQPGPPQAPAAPAAASAAAGWHNPVNAALIDIYGPRYMSAFRRTQASSNNYFAYHRRGATLSAEREWEDPDRPPLGGLHHARGAGFWDGRYVTGNRTALVRQEPWRWDFAERSARPAGARRSTKPEAARGARATRRYLRSVGLDVRLLQVLGWGGNGVASLFGVHPGAGKAPRKVVVKSLLRSGEGRNLEVEKSHNEVCVSFFDREPSAT